VSYSRKNLLRKIAQVQNVYLAHKAKGATNEFIYENYIAPVFFISRKTFYNYLATNARKELKELETKQKQSNEN